MHQAVMHIAKTAFMPLPTLGDTDYCPFVHILQKSVISSESKPDE